MISLGQIAEFIILNRRNAAYESWTLGETVAHINLCLSSNCIVVCSNSSGIYAVASGALNGTNMHVIGIISLTKQGMRDLFQRFRLLHPGVTTLSGYRRNGRLTRYQVHKLNQLL